MSAVTTQRPCSFACLAKEDVEICTKKTRVEVRTRSGEMLTVFMKKLPDIDSGVKVKTDVCPTKSSDIIQINFTLYFSYQSAALVGCCFIACTLSPLFKTFHKVDLGLCCFSLAAILCLSSRPSGGVFSQQLLNVKEIFESSVLSSCLDFPGHGLQLHLLSKSEFQGALISTQRIWVLKAPSDLDTAAYCIKLAQTSCPGWSPTGRRGRGGKAGRGMREWKDEKEAKEGNPIS